jgi:hypothetical protein
MEYLLGFNRTMCDLLKNYLHVGSIKGLSLQAEYLTLTVTLYNGKKTACTPEKYR